MNRLPDEPLIDSSNPFYCPEISKSAFLSKIRSVLSSGANSARRFESGSFARLLDKKFSKSGSRSHHITLLQSSSSPLFLASPGKSQPNFLPPGLSQCASLAIRPAIGVHDKSDPALKRKRCDSHDSVSFTDFHNLELYERSIDSVHDSSIEIGAERKRLFQSSDLELMSSQDSSYSRSESSAVSRSGSLPVVKGENTALWMEAIISRIESMLPGLGIRHRFEVSKLRSSQEIISSLGDTGHINARILELFKFQDINSLSLSASVDDAGGLNMAGIDSLRVFAIPNSFLNLTQLCISGANVPDFEVRHISRLPSLSDLQLEESCIGNEAIFLLLPLKTTLKRLNISANPYITDAAVPALILLSNLLYVSLIETSINMPGLRLYASAVYTEDRAIDIEIPSICEQYIDMMPKKYMIDPKPPLIIAPSGCVSLSAQALSRNLAAHAAYNPDIITTGRRSEMSARLRDILEQRKADLLVRSMLWGSEILP